jgi:ATP-binding cassette subfamily F protein 3
MHRDRRIKVGWFHQHQIEALDPDDTPLVIIRRQLPEASESQRRSKLAQFGLGFDKAETTVANLSGGERARLLLNLVAMSAPHLLILDEPTNHLDIDARDALVRALADFAGAVLLISHDPHLVSLVADRLWLVGDGTVRAFDGDLDDYRATLAGASPRPTAAAARPADAVPRRRDDRRDRAAARAETAPLRRAVRDAETAIAKLTAERAKIETQLADPTIYAPGAKVIDLAAARGRLAAIARETEAAEAAWLAASEALEQAAD